MNLSFGTLGTEVSLQTIWSPSCPRVHNYTVKINYHWGSTQWRTSRRLKRRIRKMRFLCYNTPSPIKLDPSPNFFTISQKVSSKPGKSFPKEEPYEGKYEHSKYDSTLAWQALWPLYWRQQQKKTLIPWISFSYFLHQVTCLVTLVLKATAKDNLESPSHIFFITRSHKIVIVTWSIKIYEPILKLVQLPLGYLLRSFIVHRTHLVQRPESRERCLNSLLKEIYRSSKLVLSILSEAIIEEQNPS